MADTEDKSPSGEQVDIEQEEDVGYQPPPEKTIDEMLQSDKDDEALTKYKAALLGDSVAGTGAVVVDPNDERKVILKKLSLVVEGRDDDTIDLTEDLATIKNKKFVLKEGVKFRIRIDFIVQREIVHGLKYVQKTYKMGVPVDKMTHMVGSYAPKLEAHSYQTPLEDAPSGMLKRGTYTVSSLFTDDDKHEHLKWEWAIDIKKDWKDE